MCGLFGCIGAVNRKKIIALARLNELRGSDGSGFFNSRGEVLKTGEAMGCAIVRREYADFASDNRNWFVAGHTRGATTLTRGARGAHPFQYGEIIGAHNGIVGAPKEYAVDSEYIFDLLSQHSGDYQTALADVSGWFALSWFNASDNSLYLLAHENTIAYGRFNDSIYYTSSAAHFNSVFGRKPDGILDDNAVMRFTPEGANIEWENLAPLVPNESDSWEDLFPRNNVWYDKFDDEYDIDAKGCDAAYWRANKFEDDFGDNDFYK